MRALILVFLIVNGNVLIAEIGPAQVIREQIRQTLRDTKGQLAVNDKPENIEIGGRTRRYLIHVPDLSKTTKPLPLVLIFHGGGSDPEGTVRYTRFDSLADREGLIAVYPEGTIKQWNDGRLMAPMSDDVGFVRALVDDLKKKYKVDAKRIYATGISNGAMMSQRLACEMSDTFAAVASVAGTLPDDLSSRCKPAKPISVMLVHGTDDPIVPYSGGSIALGTRAIGGKVWSAKDTFDFWSKHDRCSGQPKTNILPDTDPKDGTTISRQHSSGCVADTAVELLTVNGGGHTWPNSIQYLPERFIGKTSRDVDATKVIWKFFFDHPMK